MSRKVFPLLLVAIFLFSSCLYGNIVDNKYTTTGVGNLTPVKTLNYFVGSPTYTWHSGYFGTLHSNIYDVGSSNANITYNGAGQLVFADPVSGSQTLADLAAGGGGGGGNLTGSGTVGKLAKWNALHDLGDATNTDTQVSGAVTKSHTQGTDTTQGVQAADLNMGGNSVTNVNLVDGVDITALSLASHTQGTDTTLGTLSTNISMGNHYINNLGDPSLNQDAATKHYVDNYSPAYAANAGYAYNAGYAVTSNMSYNLDAGSNVTLNNHYINGLADPSVAQDAATKNYVDIKTSGFGTGNLTGSGASPYVAIWSGVSSITSGLVTGSQLVTTVGATHTQGTDTTMGTWTSNMSAGTYYLNTLHDPSVAQDAATKNYVDTKTSGLGSGNITGSGSTGYMVKWNGTGGSIVNGTNTDTDVADAVTKKHTQNTDTALGTLSTNISMGTHYINNVVDPSVAQDAATKNYVDNKVAGISAGNTSGAGATGYFAVWTGTANSTITNSTNTNTQVASAVSASHTQGTDTSLGTQASTANVTNLNADLVDGYHMNQNVLTTSSPTHVTLTLSQATGTAPLTISSTTNVTNLNADMLDGSHAAIVATASSVPVSDTGAHLDTWLSGGSFISQTIVSNGTTTYTTPAGCTKIWVRMIGAGGGGGGTTGAANNAAAGAGGGAGAYAEKLFTVTASTGYTVAVGTGGSYGANTGGTGGTGGSTTFAVGGTTVTCTGGVGGTGMTLGTTALWSNGGNGAAVSTNGDINGGGEKGNMGYRTSGTVSWSGSGAPSHFGGGGNGLTSAGNGLVGASYGTGGGGACSIGNANYIGGVGANGIIIVWAFTK